MGVETPSILAQSIAQVQLDVRKRILRAFVARWPPLWDDCGAQAPGEDLDAMPDRDMTSQSPPDYPEDQRTVW